MHRGWGRELSPGIQCGNGKKWGPCHRNVKYCNTTVQGDKEALYHRGYWPQLLWGEGSFADSFSQVPSICYKSVEWLGEQDADLPCQVLTQEEAISRNLAFSPVHPELRQSKYHQKCAHHAPAKTFSRASHRTAGFSAIKICWFSFFFPHQKAAALH